jgi:hypothetical protein
MYLVAMTSYKGGVFVIDVCKLQLIDSCLLVERLEPVGVDLSQGLPHQHQRLLCA